MSDGKISIDLVGRRARADKLALVGDFETCGMILQDTLVMADQAEAIEKLRALIAELEKQVPPHGAELPVLGKSA